METSMIVNKSSYEIENQKSWIDLPQHILALAHNKLNFPDQIRFRAVCKSWRIPDDMIKCWDRQPWLFFHSWMDTTSPDTFPFECHFFNPHSKRMHTVSNSVHTKFRELSEPDCTAKVYATFQGWSLLGWDGGKMATFFVHNVSTNQLITLPHLDSSWVINATFLNDHNEIFVYFIGYEDLESYTATLCLSRDKNWSTQVIKPTDIPKDVKYMKGEGNVYLLYGYGKLRSYSLEAKSYKLVTKNKIDGMEDSRLIEKDGDLMLVAHILNSDFDVYEWLIFKFDWSQKCWIVETSLKNTSIFISGDSTTLIENTWDTQDCRVFFLDYDGDGNWVIRCYSLTEKKLIKSEEYCWIKRSYKTNTMNFIQLAYVKN